MTSRSPSGLRLVCHCLKGSALVAAGHRDESNEDTALYTVPLCMGKSTGCFFFFFFLSFPGFVSLLQVAITSPCPNLCFPVCKGEEELVKSLPSQDLLAEGVFLNLVASFGVWSRFAGMGPSGGSRNRASCLPCLDSAWRTHNLSSLSTLSA